MRIRTLLVAITIFVGYGAVSQINNTIEDPKTKHILLVGACDKAGLNMNDYGVLFRNEIDAYEPAKSYISKLSREINNYSITIVLGTWCSDSQREVPRFYKVLDEAGYNDKSINIIAVDRSKLAGDIDIEDLKIELVPTFIVYKDNKELGRIIETPNKSLEKDLWKIIK